MATHLLKQQNQQLGSPKRCFPRRGRCMQHQRGEQQRLGKQLGSPNSFFPHQGRCMQQQQQQQQQQRQQQTVCEVQQSVKLQGQPQQQLEQQELQVEGGHQASSGKQVE
uniref:Uncharacterized protein n=1 Tax=Dunaliella tertiolecta TaxID=3047 RepID=A0A7S3QNS7_DUNTE